MAVFFIGSGSN